MIYTDAEVRLYGMDETDRYIRTVALNDCRVAAWTYIRTVVLKSCRTVVWTYIRIDVLNGCCTVVLSYRFASVKKQGFNAAVHCFGNDTRQPIHPYLLT